MEKLNVCIIVISIILIFNFIMTLKNYEDIKTLKNNNQTTSIETETEVIVEETTETINEFDYTEFINKNGNNKPNINFDSYDIHKNNIEDINNSGGIGINQYKLRFYDNEIEIVTDEYKDYYFDRETKNKIISLINENSIELSDVVEIKLDNGQIIKKYLRDQQFYNTFVVYGIYYYNEELGNYIKELITTAQ